MLNFLFYYVALAEWLRRWPAKPLYNVRMGSNPIGDGFFPYDRCLFFVRALLHFSSFNVVCSLKSDAASFISGA